MDKKEIDKIKIKGAREKLYSEINSRIFTAQRELEAATGDCCKNFEKHYRLAFGTMLEASELYGEFKKVVRQEEELRGV